MANVYLRGSTWYGRFRYRGQELREPLCQGSRAEAKKRLSAWVQRVKAKDLDGRPRRTYADAMGRFEVEYVDKLKPFTARRYKTSIRALHPVMGNLFLDEIGKSQLSEVKRRHDMAVLGSMFRQAFNWGWIDHNPVRAFDKRGLPRINQRERYLTPDEVQKLVDNARPDLGRMVTFAVQTGMRVGEMLSLRWEDVSEARGEATLWDTKNRSSRTVPLSPQALRAAGTKTGTGFVFCLPGGKRRSEEVISRRFARLCKGAEIEDATFHDLRHTFASWALQGRFPWQRGAFDIPRLMKWLGHKQVSQTMRYAHLASDDLHALLKKPGTKTGTGTKVSKRRKP